MSHDVEEFREQIAPAGDAARRAAEVSERAARVVGDAVDALRDSIRQLIDEYERRAKFFEQPVGTEPMVTSVQAGARARELRVVVADLRRLLGEESKEPQAGVPGRPA